MLAHKLSVLRSSETSSADFRRVLREITFYLGYEATSHLSTRSVRITTPMAETSGKKLAERIALVPIMRAGLGMVDSMLELLPNADVHHIGMYRAKESLMPIQYYNKLPKGNCADVCYVLDPMIATSGTICAIVNILKKWGCPKIHVVSVLASRPGLDALVKAHPDVTVTVSHVDETLSDDGMILPGLGDAGNRLFSTPTYDQHEQHAADESLVSPSKRRKESEDK